jgi:hypothetical protein
VRALVADSVAPGRIALHDVPEPNVAPGEVLVDVRAVSLNRGEMRMLGTAAEGWRPGWNSLGCCTATCLGASGRRAGPRHQRRGAGTPRWRDCRESGASEGSGDWPRSRRSGLQAGTRGPSGQVPRAVPSLRFTSCAWSVRP